MGVGRGWGGHSCYLGPRRDNVAAVHGLKRGNDYIGWGCHNRRGRERSTEAGEGLGNGMGNGMEYACRERVRLVWMGVYVRVCENV